MTSRRPLVLARTLLLFDLTSTTPSSRQSKIQYIDLCNLTTSSTCTSRDLFDLNSFTCTYGTPLLPHVTNIQQSSVEIQHIDSCTFITTFTRTISLLAPRHQHPAVISRDSTHRFLHCHNVFYTYNTISGTTSSISSGHQSRFLVSIPALSQRLLLARTILFFDLTSSISSSRQSNNQHIDSCTVTTSSTCTYNNVFYLHVQYPLCRHVINIQQSLIEIQHIDSCTVTTSFTCTYNTLFDITSSTSRSSEWIATPLKTGTRPSLFLSTL